MVGIRYKSIAFSLCIFCALIPSLAIGASLPDGLVLIKEIIFMFGVAFLMPFICLYFRKNNLKKIRVLPIDIIVIAYLLYRIFSAYLLFPLQGLPAAFYNNISILSAYILIRIWDRDIDVEDQVKIVFIIINVILLFQVAIGALQYFGIIVSHNHNFKISGTFFNPGPFGIFIACMLSYTLTYFYYKQNNFTIGIRLLFLILYLLAFCLILLCFSRASWIGLLLGVVFFIIIECSDLFKKHINSTISFLFIALTLVGVYFYNLKPKSARGRILIWNVSAVLASQNLLWGIGEGNFPYHYGDSQKEFLSKNDNKIAYKELAGDVRFAFNSLLQILVESGIIGVILFLIVLVSTIKVTFQNIKHKPAQVIPILIALISILGSSLFSYNLSLVLFNSLFFVFIALAANSFEYTKKHLLIHLTAKIKLIVYTLFILVSFTLSYRSVFTYLALFDWKSQVIYSIDRQIIALERNSFILYNNGYYLYYLGDLYLQNKQYVKAIKFLNSAKKLYSDKKVHLSLANAYIMINNIDLADQEFKYLLLALPKEISVKDHYDKFVKRYKLSPSN